MKRRSEWENILSIFCPFQDLQSEPCTVEYTLNGESLGVAFEFSKEELGGAALFPHIISKNVAFKVNFGQLEKNLLADLKAKPAKKKQKDVAEPVKPAEEDKSKKVENGTEEKREEVAADVAIEDNKPSEEEAAETVAPVEGEAAATETPAEGDSAVIETPAEGEAAATETATAVEAEVEEEEKKADDDQEAPAGDVEMKEVEESAEKKEDDSELATETKPAEEVAEEKEVAAEPVEAEQEEPLPEINRENLPGYIFIAVVEKEQLVSGPVRPESRKDCEVIMMIGLSGAGKTKWVQEWVAQHPEKQYVVLGASALIDRMKVSWGVRGGIAEGRMLMKLSFLRIRTWAVRSSRRDVARGCRSCAPAV